MSRPPCWPDGQPCPNDCAAELHRRVVYNQHWLHGPWAGWRLAGARLIAPSRDWIAPHTLDRLLYRETRLFQKRNSRDLNELASFQPQDDSAVRQKRVSGWAGPGSPGYSSSSLR